MEIVARFRDLVTHQNHREFVGADLRDADLSGIKVAFVNLTNARLDGANLSDVQFSNVILTGASLQKACLRGARMNFVEATNSNLSEVDAVQSHWENTNLLSTNLKQADLTKALFRSCTLEDACFDRANLCEGSLAYSTCNRASFLGSNLINLETIGTSFRDAKFEEAERFFSCREIVVEVLRQHINRKDIEQIKLLGVVSFMAHWCYGEWKEYLTMPDMTEYYSLALNIFNSYPKSEVSQALEQGWNWRESPKVSTSK